MDGDRKYGSIVIYDENGVPKAYAEHMPIFVLLGQDTVAPAAVKAYAAALREEADKARDSGDADLAERLGEQAFQVRTFASTMEDWQTANPDRVKLPD